MRCATYCLAQDYNIDTLVKRLISANREPRFFDDVIHVQKELDNHNAIIDIFYFPFGCISIWGANESEEKAIIEETAEDLIKKLDGEFIDVIYYNLDPTSSKTYINEEKNEIVINDDSAFIKLSVSYALAQSVKLSTLEYSVNTILQSTTPLQEELAATGRVSLSKKEISKQIGILFSERYSINLHSDILDTPEFFWRRPSYEPIYLMTADFQDIQVRHSILNHRINMIQELYTMLSNERNYLNSARMELIIAILISLEIAIGLMHLGVFSKFLPF